jgi:uncharacterized repeat protein (TIGR01451 family)
VKTDVTEMQTPPLQPQTSPPLQPQTSPPLRPQASPLQVQIDDLPKVAVGTPFTLQIRVSNTGATSANNVLVSAYFDTALEHESRETALELPLGVLRPGENRPVPLRLTPRQAGQFKVRVVAQAEGGLTSEVSKEITAQAPRVSIALAGPQACYVDNPVTWTVAVANETDLPLSNVVVTDQLPSEVSFTSATDAGQFLNGQVVWNFGNLPGGAKREVKVTTRCAKLGRVTNAATVRADPNVLEQTTAPLEILGLPAYSLDITKVGDPVQVGSKLTYRVTVTNTGSLPGKQVEIVATVPAELQVVNTDGPVKPRPMGQQLLFPAVDGPAPRQALTYTIETQAVKANNDVRFTVELRSATLEKPVVKQESTTILAPLNGRP